jgi:integrase
VAAYLGAKASTGIKASTVRRRCAAIGDVHRRAGHDNPAAHAGVKATLAGIARTLGSAPAKKTALTADLLAKALRRIPEDLTGLRDRALILIGFAAALRRSELVALDVADIAHHPKGLVITIRRSKTDQAGAGCTKAIPHGRKLGAVRALEAWLAAACITQGSVFRGVRGPRVLGRRLCAHQVARIVQKRAAAVGLDPTQRALAALGVYFKRRRSRGLAAGDRRPCRTQEARYRAHMCRSPTPSATTPGRGFYETGLRACVAHSAVT